MLDNWRKLRQYAGMTTEAIAMLGDERGKTGERQAIALVSSAHFVNHFQSLVLPP